MEKVKDTIYRQDAIVVFDCSIGGVPVESVKYVSEYADKMMSRINALPSAPERKTGEWIPLISTSDLKHHEWCGYQCSICGERTLRLTQYNFCPNCGSYNGGKHHAVD